MDVRIQRSIAVSARSRGGGGDGDQGVTTVAPNSSSGGSSGLRGPDGRQLHVLFVPSWYPSELRPLAGIFFREQAHALHDRGLKVGVISPELRGVRTIADGQLRAYLYRTSFEDDAGVPTLRAQGWNLPKLGIVNRWVWMRLVRRLAREYSARFGKPDIVHAHGGMWAALPACRIAAEWNVRAVVTEHSSAYAEGALSADELSWARRGLTCVDRVIAVSRSLASELRGVAPRAEMEVIPNLVDTTFFTFPASARDISAEFRFLAVALFLPVKRLDLLLHAFAAAFRSEERVTLEIVGGGHGEASLRALARQLGLNDRVKWSGILSREQVRSAMWRANALALSSDVETFGVAVTEAMATGLPVVATACGGPNDTVVSGLTGLLVPVGDVKAFAAALRSLYADRTRWAARAPEIRAHVERAYAKDVVIRRLMDCYSRLRQ